MAVSTAWRSAAVVLAIALAFLIVFQARRRGRRLKEGFVIKNPVPYRNIMLTCYWAVSVGIAFSALSGVLVEGAYLVGVAMLLLAAAIEFLVVVSALQD